MTIAPLPNIKTGFLNPDGTVNLPWWKWFQGLLTTSGSAGPVGPPGADGPPGPAGSDTGDLLGVVALSQLDQAADVELAGFGVNDFGIYITSDPLILGTGLWSGAVTFQDSDPFTVFDILSVPTADAVYTMKDSSLTVVGTITIPAGNNGSGRVAAWSGGAYRHPAGDPMYVLRPNPADATLGGVSAIVVGQLLG